MGGDSNCSKSQDETHHRRIIQDKAYFDEKVAPYLNTNDIVYAGNAGPENATNCWRNAYALLHPINFNEPFWTECCRSHVLRNTRNCFNKGSMSELICEGKTGFLVDTIDEAVEKIPLIRHIDRSYCRRWAEENFSKEKMVDDYLKVYRKILD